MHDIDSDIYKHLFAKFELASFLPLGKKQNVNAGLKELDKDGNGVISFEEMMRWLKWIPIEE